jgi:hypothetical protein
MPFGSDHDHKPVESGRKNSMISKIFRDRKHSTTSAAAGPAGGMVEVPDQNRNHLNHLNNAALSTGTGTGTRRTLSAKRPWRHDVSDSMSVSSETTPLVSMRANPMAGSESATSTTTRTPDGFTSGAAAATQPFKSTSTEEQKMYDDLMVKAKSMSPQEFRAYVDKHKEEMEEKYRKQGGGVLGGEWIWRDPKGKHTRTSEKVMVVMMVMIVVD